MTQKPLLSLSIFFPFYNDEGTVERQIANAYKIGGQFTDDLEVIALHGGNSKDGTFKKILEVKNKFPNLKIVDKKDNTDGYAVIKYGFVACTKDWIFYTDGDAQYHLEEDFPKLVEKQQETGADIVNGYKKVRKDVFLRVFFGNAYAFLINIFFKIPIRDVDCDFRLIRKSFMERIKLESKDASILPEMVKKLEMAGAKFVEIPVNHYRREYGQSNYTTFGLFKEKLFGDIKLFARMKRKMKNGGMPSGNIGILDIVRKMTHVLSRNPKIFIILRKILENNFKGERRVLADYFVCGPAEKVLDIGCGTGEFSVFFNPDNYIGVDIEKKYIEYAQKNYKGKFMVVDANRLPFDDEAFQKVIIVGVLHHLDDEVSGRVLDEARRVLAPDGTFLLMEDVNRPGNGFVTNLLHSLDNGKFIRTKEGYKKVLGSRFRVEKTFDMQSGLCPYQVFILKQNLSS